LFGKTGEAAIPRVQYLRIHKSSHKPITQCEPQTNLPPFPAHIQFLSQSTNRKHEAPKIPESQFGLAIRFRRQNQARSPKSIWKESAMSDGEPDRRINAFPELSDSISVMSSATRDSQFPDIPIFACLAKTPVVKSLGAPDVKDFKGRLDTGARLCLLAEHVVADRFGLERIDRSRWVTVNELGDNGVRTMGEIKLHLLMGSRTKWLEVSFQVLPDSHVKYRFDALMCDKIIKRLKILVLSPEYQ
jgi:hypothetical protein